MTEERKRLKVADITANSSAQSRVKASKEAIDAYAADMKGGANFPPVVVYFDGQQYWLADGFQRVAAARKASIAEIDAIVYRGGLREAILYSVSANANHGLRRSLQDKRRAVMTLLQDPEWGKWSNREIGRRCVVSYEMVRVLRAELEEKPAPPPSGHKTAKVTELSPSAKNTQEGGDEDSVSSHPAASEERSTVTCRRGDTGTVFHQLSSAGLQANAARKSLPEGIAKSIDVGWVTASDRALVKFAKQSAAMQARIGREVGILMADGADTPISLASVIDSQIAAFESEADPGDDEPDAERDIDTVSARVGDIAIVPSEMSAAELAEYERLIAEAIRRMGRMRNIMDDIAAYWPHGSAWRKQMHDSFTRLAWLVETKDRPQKIA